MKIDLDCTGLGCPVPVLKTREMMRSAAGEFSVLVDNPTARDNVVRCAANAGGESRVEDVEGGYLVRITPPAAGAAVTPEAETASPAPVAKRVVLVTSDEFGSGARELGTTLMKMFLYTAAEGTRQIDTIVFVNNGVRLVTENEEACAHVRTLEEAGTEVLVCGTCLDYYGLKEQLGAGRVSNMYDIQSAMIGADTLVSL